MVELTAKLRYAWVSNKKILGLTKKLCGKTFDFAKVVLFHSNKKSAALFYKLLMSCLNNAMNHGVVIIEKNIIIKNIIINKAPMLEKKSYRAKGTMDKVKQRGSHIVVTITVR